MDYALDSSENEYLKVPLGWNLPNLNLRITYLSENDTVRLNKVDDKNHIYPGPEFDLQNIPRLIEVLIKIYNDKMQDKNAT